MPSSSGSPFHPSFHWRRARGQVWGQSLSELYQDALIEGGVLNVRAGGDELNKQDSIKQAWESAFPGIKYNVTIDLSKYHDGYVDRETLHDFPRWKDAGALMQYKPAGFGQVFDEIKDSDGYYYGYNLKDKLVMTYPNDDDSATVLVSFTLIAQNPRWVRGGATPIALMSASLNGNGSYYHAYTAAFGPPGLVVVNPTDVPATTWSQTAAILAKAKDVSPANGDKPANEKFDLTAFAKYMADRPAVERFRFFIESKIGTPQGLSPLVDGL
ncbi:hypothetical protein DFJ73DRAFT_954874 [Zopfochytrium polystomum]|nr:hypothetical protein DFJ73DRAFT_954874 [Zopfochytrium polystomum]